MGGIGEVITLWTQALGLAFTGHFLSPCRILLQDLKRTCVARLFVSQELYRNFNTRLTIKEGNF